jgi:hypothetical protein
VDSDGTFKDVQNIGADINSPKDDFTYLINTQSRIEFFLVLIEMADWGI